MPIDNKTAKYRLDRMIEVAKREADQTFNRRYGDHYLEVKIVDGEPMFTYGSKGRELDKWETVKLIMSWDNPEREVILT